MPLVKNYTTARILSQAQKRMPRMPESRLNAEVLLAQVFNTNRAELYKNPERKLIPRQIHSFNRLINKFITGMPLAYLTGRCEFMSLDFIVSKNVLIPRPETELLVEEILRLMTDPKYLNTNILALEIGTGCGNIAISLAHYSELQIPNSQLRIFASDISAKALQIARKNAQINRVNYRITFCQSRPALREMFNAFKRLNLKGKFDFIISNPPYISESEYNRLPKSVRQYEPRQALYAGKSGIEFHQRIIKEALDWLKPGGYLVMEMGIGQARRLKSLIPLGGTNPVWKDLKIIPDYQDIPRVLVAQR